MARIAVLIDEMFEDVEYTQPAEAFKRKGHELVHIGLKKGIKVKGKKKGTEVTVDTAAGNASAGDYDALFIPGGYSPDHLRVDQDVLDFTKAFVRSGKPVFAICHAPQLLITADVIAGRKVTGWKSIVQDIKNAGAVYVDDAVVEDDNLLSSRGPDDLPAFIEASLKRLEG